MNYINAVIWLPLILIAVFWKRSANLFNSSKERVWIPLLNRCSYCQADRSVLIQVLVKHLSNLRFILDFSKVSSGKRELSALKLCLHFEESPLSFVLHRTLVHLKGIQAHPRGRKSEALVSQCWCSFIGSGSRCQL